MNNSFFGPNRLVFQLQAPSAAPGQNADKPKVPNPLETERSRESLYKAAEAQIAKAKGQSREIMQEQLDDARKAETVSKNEAIDRALDLNDTLARVSGNPRLMQQAKLIRERIQESRAEADRQAIAESRTKQAETARVLKRAVSDVRSNPSLLSNREGAYRFVHNGTQYAVWESSGLMMSDTYERFQAARGIRTIKVRPTDVSI